MFIKINDTDYINSDAVKLLWLRRPNEPGVLRLRPPNERDYTIEFLNGTTLMISERAAQQILLMTETDASMLSEIELAALAPLTPRSQLALSLRETFPYGATAGQLCSALQINDKDFFDYITALEKERVVERYGRLYFHASHAPFKSGDSGATSNADPSAATAAPNSESQPADNAPIVDRSNRGEW